MIQDMKEFWMLYYPAIVFVGYGTNLFTLMMVASEKTIQTRGDLLTAFLFSVPPGLLFYIFFVSRFRAWIHKSWFWKHKI
jgi:hypothetical protein